MINKISRKNEGQVGSYMIDAAYGGYKLQRIEEKGGASNVTTKYDTKKILYGKMQAFLAGLKMGRDIYTQR